MIWKGSFLLPWAVAFLMGIFIGNLIEYFPLTGVIFLSLGFLFLLWTFVNSADQEKPIFYSLKKKIENISGIFFLVLLIGVLYIQWDIQRIETVSDRLPSEKEKVLLTGWVSSPVRHLDGRLSLLLQGEHFRGSKGEIRIPGKIKFSITYPRNTDGQFVGTETTITQLRYWSIPNRTQNGIDLPTGPHSKYLVVTPEKENSSSMLVRTTAGLVECASCHNPHNNDKSAFLRESGHTLCLICHNR